ncbi:hypothetical protein MUK42_33820 [Musa troglodytarum]|uniref:Uncharacterized protein n=1 Tax=Musa troglodytarum TaxID=320322 RepID=A0A9E7FGX0_9LILI|nr:hypothetical protein MUK42_33820 [Musa troglodytarum]
MKSLNICSGGGFLSNFPTKLNTHGCRRLRTVASSYLTGALEARLIRSHVEADRKEYETVSLERSASSSAQGTFFPSPPSVSIAPAAPTWEGDPPASPAVGGPEGATHRQLVSVRRSRNNGGLGSIHCNR